VSAVIGRGLRVNQGLIFEETALLEVLPEKD
jgi:hypothetical protein